MKKNLLALTTASLAIFTCINSPVLATGIKPLIPRAGIDGAIENHLKTKQSENKASNYDINNVKTQSFSNIEAQKIASEINFELKEEQDKVLEDLRVLWQAAVERSETIKFAIFKLSNPDGEKVNKSLVKKILSPIASVMPIIGSGSGDPVTTGSSIIGGGMLNSIMADDSEINKHLSQVTDADLVILSKEIDELQQNLVKGYYNYITQLKLLEFSDKMVKNRYDYYQFVKKSSPNNISIADAFYREALDEQYKARQETLTSRTALEQLVGNSALVEVEKNIKNRMIAKKD